MKKLLIVLLPFVFFAIVIMFLYQHIVVTTIWAYTKYYIGDQTKFGLVDLPPSNLDKPSDPTDTYSSHGISFSAPIFVNTYDEGENYVRWINDNNGIVVFKGISSISQILSNKSEQEIKQIKEVYRDETLNDDYTFRKTLLTLKMDDFSIFDPSSEKLAEALLLVTKNASTYGPDVQNIYQVETTTFRGFLIDYPKSDGSMVKILEVYGPERKNYTIHLFGFGDADVHRIIDTIAFID